MFASTLGGQISRLIPFAAITLIATLVLIGRRPRIDLARASVAATSGGTGTAAGVAQALYHCG
jgi:hypothetical protein